MRREEGQGPGMDTERADHQMHIDGDLGLATGTMPRDQAVQRPSPAIAAVDTSSNELTERAWFSLLEAAQYQRPARLMYCFFFKHWLDVLVAGFLLIVLTPFLLLVALATWLGSRGPVIYQQRRIGRYGRPFTMYKFCTMIPDRRQVRHPYAGTERRKAHKTATDPRVTRTGKFLRQTSIDELPQLLNVLRGEMSLVGPRPELPEIVGTYEAWQHQRHLVRPGITGWWQMHGRSDRMMHEHTELDIYYVQNISFGIDVRILLGTVRNLASRSGAF